VPAYAPDVALVVVDVQNDFADPAGGLYVEGGEQVVDAVNAEIGAARAAGAFVVYTQDRHPPETPHFAAQGGVWPVHCVAGTWGAELHPRLRIEGLVMPKGMDGSDGYSGFSVRDPVSGEREATNLGSQLERRGVKRLVVVGLAGDVCVKETALDGRRLGYEVEVPLKTTAMVGSAAAGEQALAEMREAGVDVTSTAVDLSARPVTGTTLAS